MEQGAHFCDRCSRGRLQRCQRSARRDWCSPPGGDAMIRLHDASGEIAGVTVLRRVSLMVSPGSRIALIGRNGAGKTTTLRTLMGLISLRDGGLTIHDADCRGL